MIDVIDLLFLTLQKILLAIIIGGGIIMASAVRPLFLATLQAQALPLAPIEQMHIAAWNRYNQRSLFAALAFSLLEILHQVSHWHLDVLPLLCSLLLLLAFSRKLAVDRRLRKLVEEHHELAVGSATQQAGHREVEILSIVILFLALVNLVLT